MPELGQIIHNNPVGLPASDFVEALIVNLRSEIARVYWNVHQKAAWRGAGHSDIGYVDPWSTSWGSSSDDTTIPGIVWNSYYNWAGSPDDPDWDQAKADAPNFAFEGVEIRWYKRFGRSLNVNVAWPAEKWLRWFERCHQTIRAFEDSHASFHGDGNPTPYPPVEGVVSMSPTPEDLRYVELLERIDRLEAQLNCCACVCIDVADGKIPRVTAEDWRWCRELEWISKLGQHALTAPEPFRLHDKEDD